MPKLTVRAIEAAKPKMKEYKLTVDRGLYLRVAPDGVKTWLVRYVVDGKQRQARLPRPYGVGEACMSLADAVAENARIQSLARAGVDFQEQALAEREAKAAEDARLRSERLTVADLFKAWVSDGVARKDGNAELQRSFGKDVLPLIGGKEVRAVTEQDIRTVLRSVVARGRNRLAVALLVDLRQMFRWAERRQPWRRLLIEGNPAALVEAVQMVSADYDLSNERDRILSPDEIRELQRIFTGMQAAYDAAADRRIAERPLRKESELALWICLGTACRAGELLMAEWRHVDLAKGEWFIPGGNTKGARGKQQPQTVFLSPFALRQFQALHALTGESPWCFPASNKDEGHVCIRSLSKQVGDRQARFKNRKALERRRNDNSLVLAGGVNGEWTPHDLRRTAATMMQALGVSLDVIDRCQNHVIKGSRVRRHYLHHDYATEKREAWRLLGERLDAILSADNVVILNAKNRA